MRWMHAWLKMSIVTFRLPSCQLSPAFAFGLGCVMPAWSYPCDEEAAPAAAAAAVAAANDVAEALSTMRICLNSVAQVPASIGNLSQLTIRLHVIGSRIGDQILVVCMRSTCSLAWCSCAFFPWSGLKFDSALGFACVFPHFLDEKTLR